MYKFLNKDNKHKKRMRSSSVGSHSGTQEEKSDRDLDFGKMIEMDTPIHGIISKVKVNDDFGLFEQRFDETSLVNDIIDDESEGKKDMERSESMSDSSYSGSSKFNFNVHDKLNRGKIDQSIVLPFFAANITPFSSHPRLASSQSNSFNKYSHQNQTEFQEVRNRLKTLFKNNSIIQTNNKGFSRNIQMTSRSIKQNKSMFLNKSISLNNSMASRVQNRDYVISVIEYRANQVGLAVFNIFTGKIYLCQIVERLTYLRTISTMFRFYPRDVVFASAQQNSVLMQKIRKTFKHSTFHPILRVHFNQTKGYKIYSNKGTTQKVNPDMMFVAYSALNALISSLQKQLNLDVQQFSLSIQWYYPENTLIIEPQTLIDFQIFFNSQTKKKQHSFFNEFQCITKGGRRMLRANLIQPLSQQSKIQERQQLLLLLLQNSQLYELLKSQLQFFKQFQSLSIRFIQRMNLQNNKILKRSIQSIVLLYKSLNQLTVLRLKLQQFTHIPVILFQRFMTKLSDFRISDMKDQILNIFQPQRLRLFESVLLNKTRAQTLVFLIRQEKLSSEFSRVCRTMYAHTLEDIQKLFISDKFKTNLKLYLVFNQKRGYYYSVKNQSRKRIESVFSQSLLQISVFAKTITFLTPSLISLNNKMKENYNMILQQSFGVVSQMMKFIEERLELLFQCNDEISTIDMVLAFVDCIKRNNDVKFTKPKFIKDFGIVRFEGVVPVWFGQKKKQNEKQLFVTQAKNMIFFERQYQNCDAMIKMVSIGYMIILAQMGAFVPASYFQCSTFQFLISKYNVQQLTQNSLSHFQTQVTILNNIINSVDQNKQQGRTLIFLDEIIKGTNQSQQLSLSLAFIERLQQMNGFIFAVSSDQSILSYLQSYYPFVKIIHPSHAITKNLQIFLHKLDFPQCLQNTMANYHQSHLLIQDNNKDSFNAIISLNQFDKLDNVIKSIINKSYKQES